MCSTVELNSHNIFPTALLSKVKQVWIASRIASSKRNRCLCSSHALEIEIIFRVLFVDSFQGTSHHLICSLMSLISENKGDKSEFICDLRTCTLAGTMESKLLFYRHFELHLFSGLCPGKASVQVCSWHQLPKCNPQSDETLVIFAIGRLIPHTPTVVFNAVAGVSDCRSVRPPLLTRLQPLLRCFGLLAQKELVGAPHQTPDRIQSWVGRNTRQFSCLNRL